MKLVEYKYNDRTQLTKHFNVQEFKCKCGKNHKIIIADTLPPLLEKLMNRIGSDYAIVVSGYRCTSHDKEVGGNGSSTRSHGGYAVDIDFYDKKGGTKIDSKTVVLALEDMGHKYGIGYKCGGLKTRTHIDVKRRKWYGDESKSMSKSCCSSFYDYLGEKKQTTTTKEYTKKYIQINAKSGVWCRKGCGIIAYRKYKLIPYGTKCELITKNYKSASGYKWDKIKYKNEVVYLPNKWNKYL